MTLLEDWLTQQVRGRNAGDLQEAFDATPQWPDTSPARYVPCLQAAGLRSLENPQQPQEAGECLSFTSKHYLIEAGKELEETHVPPTWPQDREHQQMLMHLDIGVSDLPVAIAWAVEHGATEASFQPQDNVKVMLDPAGHPFCLFSSDD